MLDIRVPDTAPIPSLASRLGEFTLSGAAGKASEAEVQALAAPDKWLAVDNLKQMLQWLLEDQTGRVPAALVGVVTGDVDGNEAGNEAAIAAWAATTGYSTLVLGPGITRVGNIDIPATKKIVGWGLGTSAGSILKSGATSGAVVTCNLLAQAQHLTIDATAARKASGAADGYGILLGAASDSSPLDSTTLSDMYYVRVRNQPSDGIRVIGINQSSRYAAVTTEENLGCGVHVDDGTAEGYTNKAQAGLFNVAFLRANNNSGPGIKVGSIGQTSVPYRMTLEQAELNDNAWDAAKCPLLQGPVTLGASPISTTSGSPNIIVTQAGGHVAIRGNYVTLSGAADVGGFLAADLNTTHQVSDWISDTTFRIVMPDNASSTTTGGGAAIEVTHRAAAQAFISGQSHEIRQAGFGNVNYDQATTIGGTAKPVLQLPTGAVYLYNAQDIKFGVPRFIGVSYGWAADMLGTPAGDEVKSRCFSIFVEGYTSINSGEPTATYLFYIPRNCTGCFIRGHVHTGATNLVWHRETSLKIERAGVFRRGMALTNSPGATWSIGGTPTAFTIASGAIAAVNVDTIDIDGQGAAADDLDSIQSGIMPPNGYELVIRNRNVYDITVKHGTGNIYTRTNSDVTLGLREALRLSSDGADWIAIS